jgi:hypothetical protein
MFFTSAVRNALTITGCANERHLIQYLRTRLKLGRPNNTLYVYVHTRGTRAIIKTLDYHHYYYYAIVYFHVRKLLKQITAAHVSNVVYYVDSYVPMRTTRRQGLNFKSTYMCVRYCVHRVFYYSLAQITLIV